MAEIQLANGVVCVGRTLFRAAIEPIHRHITVGGNSNAVMIHPTKLQLSLGPAPLGSLKKPFERDDIVARDSVSGEVDLSEYLLGDGIALIGQRANHFHRPGMVTHRKPGGPLDKVAGPAGNDRLQHQGHSQRRRCGPLKQSHQDRDPFWVWKSRAAELEWDKSGSEDDQDGCHFGDGAGSISAGKDE